MKRIEFWFRSGLAVRLPRVRAPAAGARRPGPYEVGYRPILFAALLKHWGQKGPAGIEPKRAWTFRQVPLARAAARHRAAHAGAAPVQPARAPAPAARLRARGGMPNRRVCEAVLKHIWCADDKEGGADANDADRLAALTTELAPSFAPDEASVKQALKDSTTQAIALGIFGVPTFAVDGRLFWGLDALPMLAASLRGDTWFDGPAWDAEGAPRDGVQR